MYYWKIVVIEIIVRNKTSPFGYGYTDSQNGEFLENCTIVCESITKIMTTKRILAYKKVFMVFVSISVSVCLIIWLLLRIDYEQALKMLLSSRKEYILMAFLFISTTPFFCVIRWIGVLNSQKSIKVNYFQALYIVIIANILNCFLPSKSGDVIKAAFIRQQCGLSSGFGTVVLERLIDLFILGMLGIYGFVVCRVFWGLCVGITLILAVLATFAITFFFPLYIVPERVRLAATNFKNVFLNWAQNPSSIAQSFLGSIGNWLLAGLSICSLGLAINDQVNFGYLLSVYPLAIIIGLLPISISGLGTRDAAFVFLLSTYMTREQATLVGFGYSLLGYWYIAVFGLLILLFKFVKVFIFKRLPSRLIP